MIQLTATISLDQKQNNRRGGGNGGERVLRKGGVAMVSPRASIWSFCTKHSKIMSIWPERPERPERDTINGKQ